MPNQNKFIITLSHVGEDYAKITINNNDEEYTISPALVNALFPETFNN